MKVLDMVFGKEAWFGRDGVKERKTEDGIESPLGYVFFCCGMMME